MDSVDNLEKVKSVEFSDLEKPFSPKQIAVIIGGCLAVFLLIIQVLISSGSKSSYLKNFDFSKNNTSPKSTREVAGDTTYGPPGRPSPTLPPSMTPTLTPEPTPTPTPQPNTSSASNEPTPTPTPTPTSEPTATPTPTPEDDNLSIE